MPENTPFYLNWTFWAVVVAGLALILSQLPPVLSWFRRAKLDIDVYSRIGITHKVGNPNVTVHLILSNVGGRSLRIQSVSLDISRDGERVFSLPMQNYYEKPDSKGTLLATPFQLRPDEDWSHSGNFLNFFNRDDERRYKAMESAIRTNIQDKHDPVSDQLAEADEEFVEPILAFFQEKFSWTDGEYEVQINVLSDKVVASKKYRFTLFETESQELRKLADHYKYGSGIYWDRTDISQILGMELHEIDV